VKRESFLQFSNIQKKPLPDWHVKYLIPLNVPSEQADVSCSYKTNNIKKLFAFFFKTMVGCRVVIEVRLLSLCHCCLMNKFVNLFIYFFNHCIWSNAQSKMGHSDWLNQGQDFTEWTITNNFWSAKFNCLTLLGEIGPTAFCADQACCNSFDYGPCIWWERSWQFFEVSPWKLVCLIAYGTAFEPKLNTNRHTWELVTSRLVGCLCKFRPSKKV